MNQINSRVSYSAGQVEGTEDYSVILYLDGVDEDSEVDEIYLDENPIVRAKELLELDRMFVSFDGSYDEASDLLDDWRKGCLSGF